MLLLCASFDLQILDPKPHYFVSSDLFHLNFIVSYSLMYLYLNLCFAGIHVIIDFFSLVCFILHVSASPLTCGCTFCPLNQYARNSSYFKFNSNFEDDT